jgi:hypothetical protein
VARSVASQIPDLYYQGDEQLKKEYELMINLGLPVMFFNTPRDAQTVRYQLPYSDHVLQLLWIVRLNQGWNLHLVTGIGEYIQEQ